MAVYLRSMQHFVYVYVLLAREFAYKRHTGTYYLHTSKATMDFVPVQAIYETPNPRYYPTVLPYYCSSRLVEPVPKVSRVAAQWPKPCSSVRQLAWTEFDQSNGLWPASSQGPLKKKLPKRSRSPNRKPGLGRIGGGVCASGDN